MRLTSEEVAAIRECAAVHFGADATVRVFGSRLREDLHGGDIDLHVTTDEAVETHSGQFLRDLERRLGEDGIDVLHWARSEPRRPIDEIAMLTGEVLVGNEDEFVDPKQRLRMTDRAYQQLVADALEGGKRARMRLEQTLALLRPKLPVTPESLEALEIEDQFKIDSLLLQFSNMVAIVRDQLLRGILLTREGRLQSRERAEQQARAEALGIIPKGLAFEVIAKARNRVAHQYPADPVKQAAIVNEVASAVPLAIEAYDALARYANMHLLTGANGHDGLGR